MTTLTEATFRLTGVTPLLMHNVQMADPLNKWAKAVRELTNRRKTMTEEEFAAEKAKLQFLGGLYWDDDIGLHMPGYNIFRAIIEGGRMSNNGTKIEQAVASFTDKCPIVPWTTKFDNAEGLFTAGHYFTTLVKPTAKSTVPSTRPQFTEWAVDFEFLVDEKIINVAALLSCAEAAGRFKGLGDGRLKGYGRGRFDVERAA